MGLETHQHAVLVIEDPINRLEDPVSMLYMLEDLVNMLSQPEDMLYVLRPSQHSASVDTHSARCMLVPPQVTNSTFLGSPGTCSEILDAPFTRCFLTRRFRYHLQITTHKN